jgi:NAD(P)-dependent dehydrogenase (short-subunit alcohol dehydrogenase family)
VRAVVTGATSGLGRAMAEALLEAGAEVLAGARPGERLEEAVALWRSHGWLAGSLPVDVRDPGSVEEAASRVAATWGAPDLLVNNAGIGMRTVNPEFMARPRPFYEVSLAAFQNLIATNVTGYCSVAREFTRLMLRRGGGRIVCISVNRETMVRPGFVPYGPSRAATEAMALIMAEDLRPQGLTVNLLLPGGATATGMIPATIPPAVRERLLPPQVMGPPIRFLASEEAAGVTGERIVAREFPAWLEHFRTRRSSEQGA